MVLYVDLAIYEPLLNTVVQNHLRSPHLSSRVTLLTLSKPSFIVLIDYRYLGEWKWYRDNVVIFSRLPPIPGETKLLCWTFHAYSHLGSSHSRVIHPLVLNVPVVKSRSIVRKEKLISIRVRARTLLGIFAPANIPDGKSFKTWINTFEPGITVERP